MVVLEFIFRNFWTWLGTVSILYVILFHIHSVINRLARNRVLRKIGYPPPHCNADGDIIKDEKKV